jgi:hypothetical protein
MRQRYTKCAYQVSSYFPSGVARVAPYKKPTK